MLYRHAVLVLEQLLPCVVSVWLLQQLLLVWLLQQLFLLVLLVLLQVLHHWPRQAG